MSRTRRPFWELEALHTEGRRILILYLQAGVEATLEPLTLNSKPSTLNPINKPHTLGFSEVFEVPSLAGPALLRIWPDTGSQSGGDH